MMLIRVREDGSVIEVEIQEARTDASPRLQRAAQRAVLRAAPFESLPEGTVSSRSCSPWCIELQSASAIWPERLTRAIPKPSMA